MYQQRFYRYYSKHKYSLEVVYKESDLCIISDKQLDAKLAKAILIKYYTQVEDYVKKVPEFFTSLSSLDSDNQAYPIIKDMLQASMEAGIGPFSSVAGAIASYTAAELLNHCSEIMVENGGDILLKINRDRKIGLYLGKNLDLEIVTIKAAKRDYCFGICSSSSKIGPSLNFGKADLLTVIAKDAIRADSLATAYSNEIKKEADINPILQKAQSNPFIEAVVIVFEGRIFLWGDVEIAA